MRDYTYVDKTLAVKRLVDRRGVTLFCRPRGFGKSTFLSMLRCFFECPVEGYVPDRRGLFDGLAIAGDGNPRYMGHNCTHPVIHLDLSGCGAATFEKTVARIADAVSVEYSRHRYLCDAERMFPQELDRFERLATGTEDTDDLLDSLSWLSTLLAGRHGAKTVILIDGYDAPVACAHLHGFGLELRYLYRSWLTGALKGTVDLYCAALAAVLRVSEESVYSGLNNVQYGSTLDNDFADAIGLTAAEAEALAAHVGRADCVVKMAALYGGYRFGDTDACNTRSVLGYLESGEARPYRAYGRADGAASDLIRRACEAWAGELAELVAGGTVVRPLDLRCVFDDPNRNPEAVWSLLYQSGYVTTDDTGRANDDEMPRRLRVPN